jgi:uncharacterized protein YbaR (Trm112 family)
MKRVRCPKCDHFIVFDETKYQPGQSLIFQCPECNKQFGIRIGTSKLLDKNQKTTLHPQDHQGENDNDEQQKPVVGSIVVIENVFHYKQTIHLRMGDNVIGRYQKGNPINTPIETVDPSVDNNHCAITVSRDKHGRLRYVLRDTNSNTGTFVDNVEIPPRERRVIEDGTLFTIGATSIILRTPNKE